jgi:hypothetical protein
MNRALLTLVGSWGPEARRAGVNNHHQRQEAADVVRRPGCPWQASGGLCGQ